jgi:hypothetical protein
VSAALDIGRVAKPVRRQGANHRTIPNQGAPLVANKQAKLAKPARRRASIDAKPNDPSPSAVSISATVTEIVQLQRIRRFCIKSQSRCDRSMESLIASMMGYRLDMSEKDKKAVFARAKAFRVRVEGGEGQPCFDTQGAPALSALHPLIAANATAREPWDTQRAAAEKQMERLAESLPIADFVRGVRGLGMKGMAILIGEAGIPIGDYRTVSGLWKRYGLAVVGGRAQRRAKGDAAGEQGFAPARRAEVWAVCSDSLFRAQWRGADEEAGLPARPIGPYGDVYARRRAHTGPRIEATAHLPLAHPEKWTKGRCHNDARRVMTKELVRDIWGMWRLGAPATQLVPW